ncbi:MAG: hypothetical protein GXP14_07440 [Gammaproteobacteria bacterium]|nr:hypothetical protein [Gammaproteobacteria bacterium]
MNDTKDQKNNAEAVPTECALLCDAIRLHLGQCAPHIKQRETSKLLQRSADEMRRLYALTDKNANDFSVEVSYSLTCTDCGTSFFEKGTGIYHFETSEEVIKLAKAEEWRIGEEVPNGSKWNFCPRCILRRGDA